ncbi:importin subunit alpha [Anaeramoeba ignava]|uniref:Importin subunit alpha n=1 Tax=Anaeramoeba ignava TaxID=1746090 RepID=A0A9Q0LJ02_ANAIG|nr:importin subunit alpha [Anaeramoeba ignava]
MLDKIGAWNLIEKLQIHQNQEIYEKANHLIEEFFIPYKGMEIELCYQLSKQQKQNHNESKRKKKKTEKKQKEKE